MRPELQVFNGQIDEFSRRSGIALETVIRRLALEIYNGVTLKTPVDTGRARASWNLHAGAPSVKVVPTPFGDAKVEFRDYNKEEIDAFATAEIGTFENLGTLYVQPVFVTNGLHYIIYLEHGSSKQAPQGMVSLTLNEVEISLKKALASF